MSELRSILRGLESHVAAAAQGGPEFSLESASRKVHRNRVTRTVRVAAAAVCAVAVIGTGAWTLTGQFNHNQPAITTPSPSALVVPTVTPSASPTPTVSAVPATPLGHNPSMDDAEALLRAEHPATGERWLSHPQPMDAPSWAGQTRLPGDWLLIGSRGDRDIMILRDGNGWFYEADKSGANPAVIVAPFPFDDPAVESARYGESTPEMDAESYPDVPLDKDTSYDSLALPAQWTAADGAVVRRADMQWFYEQMGYGEASFTLTDGQAFGGSQLVRLDASADTVNPYEGGSEFTTWLSVHATARLEAIRLPFGIYWLSSALPLNNDVPLSIPNADDSSFNGDFFDTSCAGTPAFEAIVKDPDLGEWVQIGTWGDTAVYAPTQENPLATGMWAAWNSYNENLGDPSPLAGASLAEYLAAPAIVATPTADGSGWWLGLNSNRNFTMRYWC